MSIGTCSHRSRQGWRVGFNRECAPLPRSCRRYPPPQRSRPWRHPCRRQNPAGCTACPLSSQPSRCQLPLRCLAGGEEAVADAVHWAVTALPQSQKPHPEPRFRRQAAPLPPRRAPNAPAATSPRRRAPTQCTSQHAARPAAPAPPCAASCEAGPPADPQAVAMPGPEPRSAGCPGPRHRTAQPGMLAESRPRHDCPEASLACAAASRATFYLEHGIRPSVADDGGRLVSSLTRSLRSTCCARWGRGGSSRDALTSWQGPQGARWSNAHMGTALVITQGRVCEHCILQLGQKLSEWHCVLL